MTENRPEDRPLILGLTASVLNDRGSSTSQNRTRLAELEKTFHAAVVGPKEATDSLLCVLFKCGFLNLSGRIVDENTAFRSSRYKTCAEEHLIIHENPQFRMGDEIMARLEDVRERAEKYGRDHKALKKMHKNSALVRTPLLEDASNLSEDLKKLFSDWTEAYQSLGKNCIKNQIIEKTLGY